MRREGRILADAESASGYVDPSAIGFLHIALGEKGKGYSYLEKGFREREPTLMFQWVWWTCADLMHEERLLSLLKSFRILESSLSMQ